MDCLKTLLLNRPGLLRPTDFFFLAKKSATIAFFSSPPFLLLAFSLSLFLFLRFCDFGASRATKPAF